MRNDGLGESSLNKDGRRRDATGYYCDYVIHPIWYSECHLLSIWEPNNLRLPNSPKHIVPEVICSF